MPQESYIEKTDWSFLEDSEFPRVYRAGDLIYRQDDEAIRFYYLYKGEVRIFMTSEEGAEQTLTIKKPGSIFGEAAFFDGEPRISSARALSKCSVFAIDRPLILSVFSKRPEFALNLLQSMARNTRMLSNHIDRMAFRQADERMASLLLELQNEHHEILQTQEELAQLMGVTRITVTRVLKEFSDLGFVRRSYRKLTLIQPSALEHYTKLKTRNPK